MKTAFQLEESDFDFLETAMCHDLGREDLLNVGCIEANDKKYFAASDGCRMHVIDAPKHVPLGTYGLYFAGPTDTWIVHEPELPTFNSKASRVLIESMQYATVQIEDIEIESTSDCARYRLKQYGSAYTLKLSDKSPRWFHYAINPLYLTDALSMVDALPKVQHPSTIANNKNSYYFKYSSIKPWVFSSGETRRTAIVMPMWFK